MTTEAQNVKYARQLKKLEACRRTPDKVKMLRRERIRIKRRCQRDWEVRIADDRVTVLPTVECGY